MLKNTTKGSLATALDDSIFVKHVLRIYGSGKKYISEYVITSKAAALVRTIRTTIYSDLIRNLGLIILIAVITNISVSLLLAKGSDPLSWFIRAIFLIIGALWASCRTGFDELKKTSFVYKKLKGL